MRGSLCTGRTTSRGERLFRRRYDVSVSDFHSQVRRAAAKRLLFLPHAVRQMSRPDRMISSDDVDAVVRNGEIIEEYPQDARGPSCLMLGRGSDGHPIHVVCAPKDEYLAIITAYHPEPSAWSADLRRRMR
jgi:hypothetical protein